MAEPSVLALIEEPTRSLSMTLGAGLAIGDLGVAEPLLQQLVPVTLAWKHDRERGGEFLEYDALETIDTGIRFIQVEYNDAGTHWLEPRRQDLPLIMELTLGGTDLLDLGRWADRLVTRGGDALTLLGYSVIPRTPGAAGRALPHGHGLEFASREEAAPRWQRGLEGGAAQSAASGASSHTPPLPTETGAPPALLCHLTFGFSTMSVDEIAAEVGRVLGVPLSPHDASALGGRCFGSRRDDAPVGELVELLVRPNALDQWTKLYPRHPEHVGLLDLSLVTPNLLEPGRIAAFIEARCPSVTTIAYRVVGDLVGDRVPRMLDWERPCE